MAFLCCGPRLDETPVPPRRTKHRRRVPSLSMAPFGTHPRLSSASDSTMPALLEYLFDLDRCFQWIMHFSIEKVAVDFWERVWCWCWLLLWIDHAAGTICWNCSSQQSLHRPISPVILGHRQLGHFVCWSGLYDCVLGRNYWFWLWCSYSWHSALQCHFSRFDQI